MIYDPPLSVKEVNTGSVQHGAVIENRHLAYLVIGTAIKTFAGKLLLELLTPGIDPHGTLEIG